MGFVYIELIIVDVEGIFDFEEFIYVIIGSYVVFFVEMLFVFRIVVK